MDAIRVVLADHHPIVRIGIRHLLEQAPDIQVIGETGDGAEALRLTLALTPDVLVLEVRLSGIAGLEVARQLSASESGVRILVFTAYDDEPSIAGMIACGAYGYLTKDETAERLVGAICGAARGEVGWFSRRAAARLARHQIGGADIARVAALSRRERQVLRLLARGYDNQRIAAVLSIAEGTVKNHVTNMYEHLDVRTRVEAAA